MTGEAVTQAGGKNDENVSVIGREQCGYSRNASKFTGEDYPLCLRLNGRRERSGPPAMRMVSRRVRLISQILPLRGHPMGLPESKNNLEFLLDE